MGLEVLRGIAAKMEFLSRDHKLDEAFKHLESLQVRLRVLLLFPIVPPTPPHPVVFAYSLVCVLGKQKEGKEAKRLLADHLKN
jgi:hypothetical protein